MKRACIDTHVVVWHLSKPSRIRKRARRLLRDADAGRAEILVPAVVLVELSLLQESGRRVPGVAQVQALCATQPAFRVQPLAMADGLEFALLSALQDPFDRMIVAAARAAGLPLVTADETIRDSALVETIWE
jgi:PIN domain nuclease of toxin-antitoxin system